MPAGRRIGPGDLEPVLGGLRRLDGTTKDGDAGRQSHHVRDTGYRARRRIVDCRRRSALIGRLQHRGIEHAGQPEIDSVFRGAGDFARQFDARQILADIAEARRAFEILLLDLRKLRRRLSEGRDLAVARPATGSLVDD